MIWHIGEANRLRSDSTLWKSTDEWFTVMIELHPDFKDFLKLLTSQGVNYLLVGGYAVDIK